MGFFRKNKKRESAELEQEADEDNGTVEVVHYFWVPGGELEEDTRVWCDRNSDSPIETLEIETEKLEVEEETGEREDKKGVDPPEIENKKEPSETQRLLAKGEKKYIEGDYDGALKCIDEMLDRKSKYTYGWFTRGIIYIEKNNFAEALDSFQNAEKTISKRKKWHAILYTNMGAVEIHFNKLDKALEYTEKALKINPNMTAAKTNRKLILKKQKRKLVGKMMLVKFKNGWR